MQTNKSNLSFFQNFNIHIFGECKIIIFKKKFVKSIFQLIRLVSENFVKIDLRKKTYVRGLKKASVSSQKRRAWRSKTCFELPSKTGKKTCFKCGGEGHWAKFCRGRPKQVDLFKYLLYTFFWCRIINKFYSPILSSARISMLLLFEIS